jgi:hypothetical protein
MFPDMVIHSELEPKIALSSALASTVEVPDLLSLPLSDLYDQDFCLWLATTVEVLRDRRFSQLDLENLIEEIESMGRSEKSALRNNLIVVLLHLLKYKFQPEKRSNSWRFTLFEHRRRLQEALEDSPSLKNYYQTVLSQCYQNARKGAALETGLDIAIFPEQLPFSPEKVLDSDYSPD